ncbi:hypothetical protein [Pandoraea fibrosis]|uniref:Uncharacterized protein n=1 Tax=Pandoraea fibrosis TaxID=1891094 RepID=A0A5E4RLU6_9BURK|nr:hypothetical protein [Pandoraea fibrosis]VVD64085.1 hypothetical protein PFI31113_00261 [Pandoraea fibrosis]
MAYVIPFYRGFRLETFVFRHHDTDSAKRQHDRTFGVSVRISRTTLEDPAQSTDPKVFRLESLPFDSIGEARRAGNSYAQSLIDDIVRDGLVKT